LVFKDCLDQLDHLETRVLLDHLEVMESQERLAAEDLQVLMDL